MLVPIGYRPIPATIVPYPQVRADYAPKPIEGLGGCGCTGIRSVGTVIPPGLGAIEGPALFASVTGYTLGDALLGAAIGYIAAPSEKERGIWASGAAIAGALAGTLGMVATVGAAIWSRSGGRSPTFT